jgi:hypothetical protein
MAVIPAQVGWHWFGNGRGVKMLFVVISKFGFVKILETFWKVGEKWVAHHLISCNDKGTDFCMLRESDF